MRMKLKANHQILIKAKNVRRERHMRRLAWSCGVLLLSLACVVYVLRLPRLQLQDITIVGVTIVPQQEITAVVEEAFSGFYLGVIPKKNFLLYSREAVREALLRRFVRIAAVTFTEKSPQALLVTIEERTPWAVWCEGSFRPLGERTCLYMDRTGVLYDEAPRFSAPIYFEFYGASSTAPHMGKQVLAATSLEYIALLRGLLVSAFIEPVALTLEHDGTLALTTSKGWRLLFSPDGNPLDMVRHLQAALSAEALSTRLADKGSKLDYVDLRFGQKVFYKFLEQETATTSQVL